MVFKPPAGGEGGGPNRPGGGAGGSELSDGQTRAP